MGCTSLSDEIVTRSNSKKISHCDGWAVKKLIEKDERPTATVLRLCSERIFEKMYKKVLSGKLGNQICRDAYLSIKPEFEIRTVKFRGYCPVSVSPVVRSKGFIFKKCLKSFNTLCCKEAWACLKFDTGAMVKVGKSSLMWTNFLESSFQVSLDYLKDFKFFLRNLGEFRTKFDQRNKLHFAKKS